MEIQHWGIFFVVEQTPTFGLLLYIHIHIYGRIQRDPPIVGKKVSWWRPDPNCGESTVVQIWGDHHEEIWFCHDFLLNAIKHNIIWRNMHLVKEAALRKFASRMSWCGFSFANSGLHLQLHNHLFQAALQKTGRDLHKTKAHSYFTWQWLASKRIYIKAGLWQVFKFWQMQILMYRNKF